MPDPTNVRNTRSASAADFTATNPWLDEGEERIETDTGKSKIGPGYWNDLSYGAGQTGGGSGASGLSETKFSPVAHSDADLVTGVVVGTLAPGTTVYDGRITNDVIFNGTTPSLTVLVGAVYVIYGWRLDKGFQEKVGNPNISIDGYAFTFSQFGLLTQNFIPFDMSLGGDVTVIIDDGSGGPAGATQGLTRLHLTTGPTPA